LGLIYIYAKKEAHSVPREESQGRLPHNFVILAVNKSANLDCAFTGKYEAGLVLTGARGKIGSKPASEYPALILLCK